MNPHLSSGALLSSVVYAVLGGLMLLLGYRVFDLINRVDFTAEIGKGNVAVGVLMAGFFIALSIVIAAAIV